MRGGGWIGFEKEGGGWQEGDDRLEAGKGDKRGWIDGWLMATVSLHS